MVELLTDKEFSKDKKNFLWAYSPAERHNPTRRFGEINSGTQFRDAAHLSGADRPEAKYRLCPILVWTDKCSPDFKRQAQLKPIAVACGNLIGSICRKVSGKRLAGFWPKGLQVVAAAPSSQQRRALSVARSLFSTAPLSDSISLG